MLSSTTTTTATRREELVVENSGAAIAESLNCPPSPAPSTSTASFVSAYSTASMADQDAAYNCADVSRTACPSQENVALTDDPTNTSTDAPEESKTINSPSCSSASSTMSSFSTASSMFSTTSAASSTTTASLRSSSSHERLRDATPLSSKRLSTVNEGCTSVPSTSMSLHQYAYAEDALSPPPAHGLKHATSRERLGLATLSECGSDGEGSKVRFHDACVLIPRKPKKTRGRGLASLLPLPGRSPSREPPARLAPVPLPPCLRPSSVPSSPVETPDGRPGIKRADTLPLPDSHIPSERPFTRTPSPLTPRTPSPTVHRPIKETPKPLSSVKAFTRMARSSSFTMFLTGSAPTMSPSNPLSSPSVKSPSKPTSAVARKEKDREVEKCKLVPLRACCPDCVASTERAHKLEETFSAGARIVLHGLALELDVSQVAKNQQEEQEEEAELFPVPNKRCSIMLKNSSVTSLPSFPTPDEDDNDLFPLPSRKRCSVMVRKERVGSITSSIRVDDDADPAMVDEDDTACADVPTIVIRPTSSHRRSISEGCFTWRWEEKDSEAQGLTVDSALQCLEGQRPTREKRATQLIVCPTERRKVAPWPEPHPGPDPSLICGEVEEDNHERERRKSRRLTWSANLLGKVVSVQ